MVQLLVILLQYVTAKQKRNNSKHPQYADLESDWVNLIVYWLEDGYMPRGVRFESRFSL